MISIKISAIKRRGELRRLAKLPDGKIWVTRDHRSWGNRIAYERSTDEGHLFVGWLPTPPKPGDLIEHATKEGMAQFKVLEVQRVRDPDDMFWALTSHLGRIVGP